MLGTNQAVRGFMQLIEKHFFEHRELEDAAARLARIVDAAVPDAAAVAAVRWNMAAALLDHCANGDRQVYERLVVSGDGAAIAAAWRFRQEHGETAESFRRYVQQWPVARITREWREFQAETRLVLSQLAACIAMEEAVLHPHLKRLHIKSAA